MSTTAATPGNPQPLGIFDSGIGGLSVWREIVRQLPHESTVYVADQAHVPYGPRGELEIRQFSERITEFLLQAKCKAVVVACNTASAAALHSLRERFPSLPCIGMEPAVKPAAASTHSKVVGIMATPATFHGRLFEATAGKHAQHVQLINQVCTGLADQVEAGRLDTPDTEAMLNRWLQPMLDAGADTVVLACTHYPFVIDSIRRIVGPAVNVIDPAPAVARQVARVLTEAGLSSSSRYPPSHRFITTGDATNMQDSLSRLVQVSAIAEVVRWEAQQLVLVQSQSGM